MTRKKLDERSLHARMEEAMTAEDLQRLARLQKLLCEALTGLAEVAEEMVRLYEPDLPPALRLVPSDGA